MSLKLKLLRERKEDQSVDTDLRGLGGEALFKHFHPTVVLSQKGPVSDSLKQILFEHGVRIQASSHPGVTHFSVSSARAGSHKLDAVKLYSCALAFTSHEGSHVGRFALWEQRPFKTLMSNAMEGKHLQEAPLFDDHFWITHFHAQDFLQIMAPVAKYLHEAGFAGFSQHIETVSLKHDELRSRLEKELEQLAAEEAAPPLRKVG